MKSPLQRIQHGGIVLAVILVSSVCGYRYLAGYDWIDAVWMVVVTISTVGYSEQSTLPPSVQMFTALVIVFGISASAYTFGGLVQWMIEGELERVMGVRRMTREVNRMRNHIIVCGYGRMGHRLASELKSQGRTVVVIEINHDSVAEATADGLVCIDGDATEEDVLESAGIAHAHSLVAALPNDAESVFITLTARNLNPELRIIARAEQESTEKKLRQAGANHIVLPTVVGAGQMVRMITRPSTAELMELFSQNSLVDLELDEIEVPADSRLVGVTIRDTNAHRDHQLLFVAIKQCEGKMVFSPDAKHRIGAHEILMVIGHRDGIDQFRKSFGLPY